jgi:hypothetical protein
MELMGAYNELYTAKIKRSQGKVFYLAQNELPKVDVRWFIEKYMRSKIREQLDIANPKMAAKPAPELIHAFINRECDGTYDRGEGMFEFTAQWIGEIYSLYQWKYGVPSAELIDLLPLSDMERMYIPGHEMGWNAAVDKIHSVLTTKNI